MIKTIELDCGIKFSLWSDFDKIPTNGIYLTLEVRDRDEVLKSYSKHFKREESRISKLATE